MMKPKDAKPSWGQYYYKNKNDWRLEVLHSINQAIPTFNELFDEESFYVFVLIVIVASILLVVFLSKCVGVKVREHHLVLEREMGAVRPANLFEFPWQAKKEE